VKAERKKAKKAASDQTGEVAKKAPAPKRRKRGDEPDDGAAGVVAGRR
jgi:hypothetical protein